MCRFAHPIIRNRHAYQDYDVWGQWCNSGGHSYGVISIWTGRDSPATASADNRWLLRKCQRPCPAVPVLSIEWVPATIGRHNQRASGYDGSGNHGPTHSWRGGSGIRSNAAERLHYTRPIFDFGIRQPCTVSRSNDSAATNSDSDANPARNAHFPEPTAYHNVDGSTSWGTSKDQPYSSHQY